MFTHLAVRPEKTVLPAEPYPELEHKALKKADKAHYLLGLVHGYYTITSQEDWVSKTDQPIGENNTGISIVVPASKIMDTINQPQVSEEDIKMARRHDERRKRESGARTASVPAERDPPSNDENPNHREDFTRLLNAAAQKPPQED